MPSKSLHSLVCDISTALKRERDAWATARDAASLMRFAAVMGPALSRQCPGEEGWDIRESIESDQELTDAIWNVAFRTGYHYNKEAVRDHYVVVEYINTQSNISDICTKGLGTNKIREFTPYLTGHKPLPL